MTSIGTLGQNVDVELMLENSLQGGHRPDYVIPAGQGLPLPRMDGGLWPPSFRGAKQHMGGSPMPRS